MDILLEGCLNSEDDRGKMEERGRQCWGGKRRRKDGGKTERSRRKYRRNTEETS